MAGSGGAEYPPLSQQFVHFFHEAAASTPTARPVRVGLGGPAGTGASRRIFRLRGKDERFSLPSVRTSLEGMTGRECGHATPTTAVLEEASRATDISVS